MDNRWLSVDEVGVQRNTIYTRLALENLPRFKVGRSWRFKREELDAWARSPERRQGADEEDEPS